jgi:hypothetical protein
MSAIAQPANIERRVKPRVDGGDYLLRLDAGDGSTPIACFVCDISLSGARLRLSKDLELPKIVKVLINNVLHPARVVWRKESQIGIEFVE